MESIAGFILAGGASSRMGTDKARLTISGKTFVQLIAEEMSHVASRITVVSNDPGLNTGLPTVSDIYERWGALGGVHAGLAACQLPWALVVACDLPLVKAPLFSHLSGLQDDFEAVAPIQPDGRPQPLCALYRVEPGLVMAEQLIKSGERRPIALLQSIRTRWVTFAEIENLAGAGRFFDNINTPQDYAGIDERSQ